MVSGWIKDSLVYDGNEQGEDRHLDIPEGAHVVRLEKTATKNTTTTWDLSGVTFNGRGIVRIKSLTNPDGDGNVTVKVDTNDANNEALNIKPSLRLSQNPTTLYLINASTTADEVIELIGITDENLT